MLIERGRVEAPFRLLGAWSGVTLGSADRADDPPGGWRHVTIRIEPTGRASLDEGQTGIPLVAPRHGDTIWRIEFDPISGVPAVRAP